MQALQRPPAISSLRGRLRLRVQLKRSDLVSTCRGAELNGRWPGLTPSGGGEPCAGRPGVTRAGQPSGRPPGAVPMRQRDAELAAVLGGDHDLDLGDSDRWSVVLRLEQPAGR